MPATRAKFAARISSEILSAVHNIADREQRPIQALVEEAFVDLIEKHKKAAPRAYVMAAYLSSDEKYASLYEKLAE